jgi:hypothetical protein
LGRTGRQQALTALELLMVIACLLIVAALLLPALIHSQARPSKINCTNNLKQIGLSCRTWGLDNNDHYPAQVSVTNGGSMELVQSGVAYIHFEVLSNELSTPKVLICPEDNTRTAAVNWLSMTDTNLSYFYCPDAADTLPQGFLAGDDNLKLNGMAIKRGLQAVLTKDVLAWTEARHKSHVTSPSQTAPFSNSAQGSLPTRW